MPNNVIIVEEQTVITVPDSASPTVLTIGIQGPPGVEAPLNLIAHGALGGHKVVHSRGDGTVEYADCATLAQINTILGVTLGAASDGAPIDIRPVGRIDEPSWNWNPALPLYLGNAGQLTQTLPLGAAFLQIVGEVISPTAINVRLSDPTIL